MRLSFKIIVLILLASASAISLSLRRRNMPANQIKQRLVDQADSLLSSVKLLQVTPAHLVNRETLQKRFRKIRLMYKRLEWATEYFDPLTGRKVNGPPIPETEFDGSVIKPDGLQIIEPLLFPDFAPGKKQELKGLLDRLALNTMEFRSYFQQADLQDWQILDAVKLEVFRVEALGLNQFDDPLSGNCFAESAAALESLQYVMTNYTTDGDRLLAICFQKTIQDLMKAADFNKFDRAAFLTQDANPLTRALTDIRKRIVTPDVQYNRLMNQNAATLFDRYAFNSNAFTAAPGDSMTGQKIALGRKLFFETRLSGTMTRSCASCHQPDKAFTDGLEKNTTITGKKKVARNTPTLINAALQPTQFYDSHAKSLEELVADVIRNRDEMHGNLRFTVRSLWQDVIYRDLFSSAFPVRGRHTIDTLEIMNALASYLRSITALNSRFDAYMQGTSTSLTAAEINGFNLFMGKARCSTCHYLPLFNGTLPPKYIQMDAEVIGVPKTGTGRFIDPDPGIFAIVPERFNRYKFKIPTLRNAGNTSPYMHNGVFRSLENVIDFYNKGGGAGSGIKISNQTLAADKLHLTVKEKKELVAFIKSLNSK